MADEWNGRPMATGVKALGTVAAVADHLTQPLIAHSPGAPRIQTCGERTADPDERANKSCEH